MTNDILTSKQLFLLCALRKRTVEAKNLKIYDFTIIHWQIFLDECSKGKFDPREKLVIMNEIKERIPGQEPRKRLFSLTENDFGFSLADQVENLSWYQPPISIVGSSMEWEYKGEFTLYEPLTDKEKFILQSFAK